MSFDSIPEDREMSFPCPDCDNGNVTKNDNGEWECNSCDFVPSIKDEVE